jgi:hypothetical protein
LRDRDHNQVLGCAVIVTTVMRAHAALSSTVMRAHADAKAPTWQDTHSPRKRSPIMHAGYSTQTTSQHHSVTHKLSAGLHCTCLL